MSNITPATPDEDALSSQLREIIWYELGNDLNATYVDECVTKLEALITTQAVALAESVRPERYVIQANTDSDGRIYEGGYNQALDDWSAALKAIKQGDEEHE